MATFGDNVRWLRTRLGMTQAELAALVSLGGRRHPVPHYISMIERGSRDPGLRVIRSIAKALKVKPWYLLAELAENPEFWDGYLRLPPQGKREIQRRIEYMLERRGS
jgi:transcriptional regulator with XRE-family HTH domain